MQVRMAELRAMGLEDIPYRAGVRSSMRVYAEASILVEDEEKNEDGSPHVFGTLDAELIKHADSLEQRYNLRPCGIEESKERLKGRKDATPMTSARTIQEAAKAVLDDLLQQESLTLSSEEYEIALEKTKEHMLNRIQTELYGTENNG
jgi:hypothetical protein